MKEEEYENRYGGIRKDVTTLPVGTEFWVCNGHWEGKIERIGGNKYVTSGGEIIINLSKYSEYILYIDLQ